MKYLLFNCAVFLALGYLILGGNPEQAFEQIRTNTEVVKETVQEKVAPQIEKAAPAVVEKIEQAIPEIKQVAQPILEPRPAPAIIEDPIEVAKPIVNKIPSPAEGQPEVIEMVEAAPVAAPSPEQALVDAKERSQSLREMAAEMEQMFAEKMTW